MSTKSLKETYRWHLRSFVALNALVFFALFTFDDIILAFQLRQLAGLVTPNAALALTLPLVTLFLDGIVPAYWKAVLVYRRFVDPLPGTEAFTEHGPADTRVDMKALGKKYGPLPDDANEQNRLWYKLSKVVGGRPSVAEAHRGFLLTRDLASISFVVVPLGAILGAVLRIGVSQWSVIVAALTLQYLGLSLVAANKGRRFVTTVLAEAAADTD